MLPKDISTRILNQEIQHQLKTDAQKNRFKKDLNPQRRLVDLRNICLCFTEDQLRLNNLNQEQESCSWLTSLPLAEEEYDLIKKFFWDLIQIFYSLPLTRLPDYCEYGEKFDLHHAVSCKKGWLCIITTQPCEKHNIITHK